MIRVVLCILALAVSLPANGAPEKSPDAQVKRMVNELLDVAAMSDINRQYSTLAVFIDKNFSWSSINRRVLGRYVRDMDVYDKQKAEATFRRILIASMTDAVTLLSKFKVSVEDGYTAYPNNDLKVTLLVTGEDETIKKIMSDSLPGNQKGITKDADGNPTVQIALRLQQGTGAMYQIIDLEAFGSSAVMTLQNNFAKLISENGGNVRTAVNLLADKLGTLEYSLTLQGLKQELLPPLTPEFELELN